MTTDSTDASPIPSPLKTFRIPTLIDQMKQEEIWYKSGRNAKTVLKTPWMRLVLNTMKAGTGIKKHQTKGPISIHCIEGELKLNVEDSSVILQKGDLLTLEENTLHSVDALQETAFLLTIAPMESSKG